jgi:hypothetical protein
MASLSPGPSLLILGALRTCLLTFVLPQELHSIVVTPFTLTPSVYCTKRSITGDPG